MYYGWRIMGVTLISQAFQAGLLIYAFGVIILPLAVEFDASRESLMIATALLSLSSNLISPLAGMRVDHASLRNLMILGGLSMGIGFIALSQVRAVWQVLTVFGLIMPLGNLLLGQLSASALMTQWFRKRRGRALGLSAIGTSIGGLLLPPLLAIAIGTLGWRLAFVATGATVMLICLPLFRFVVVDRPELIGLQPDGGQTGSKRVVGRDWSIPEILRTAMFWRITITIGLVLSVYLALLSNLVPHASDQGIPATAASLLMSVLALLAIAGKLIFGMLADRIALRTALWIAMLLMAAGLGVLLMSAAYSSLALACALLGLAAGGLLPIWGAMVARGFGRVSFGRALGVMNPAMMPLTLVGAPLAGRIFDRTGSYDMAFLIFLAALGLAALVLAGLRLPDSEVPP